MTAPYQAFSCADGYITIGAANDRNFTKLARVLGHHEWLDRRPLRRRSPARRASRRAGRADRSGHREGAARRSGSSELEQAGIPCGPILDYEDALDDAAGDRARDDRRCRASDARRRCARSARRSRCRRRRSTRSAAARCSASTPTMCSTEAGYSDDEIEQLRYAGAVADVLRSFDDRSTIVLRSSSSVRRTSVERPSNVRRTNEMVTMRLSRTFVIILMSGVVGAGLAAQRGGGTRVAAGQECPPGTTEVRPGSCQAPSEAPPSILDYRPSSTLVTVEHKVPKAKFPAVDVHGHPGQSHHTRRDQPRRRRSWIRSTSR